jgi:hypothetical protein
MKKGFLIAGLVCFSASVFSQVHTAKKTLPYSAANKTVKVFVTEKGSNKRLAPAGELKFETEAQPPETETVVFVDPAQKFQTMLGIGGALTDAVAETFYKLPKDKQAELLDAYYIRKTALVLPLPVPIYKAAILAAAATAISNRIKTCRHLILATIKNTAYHLSKRQPRQPVAN